MPAAGPIYRWLAAQEPDELQKLHREFVCDSHRLWPKDPTSQQAQVQGRRWEQLGRETRISMQQAGQQAGQAAGAETMQAQIEAAHSRRLYKDFLRRFAVMREEPRLDPDEFDLGYYSYGLRTYGNLLKYLKTTVSSNFGNVLSVTVASLFLPFLPMSALQLVLLSLVYEIVCIALPWDTVDDAWTARPRAWDAASIKGFMLELGPVSSLFDIVTFTALFFVVCPAAVNASWPELAAAGDVAGMATFAALFQSGWFVESMWSQTLVVHMLRSPHLPSPRDHAAPALCALTVLGLALVTWLPASPIADALGLMTLPASFFALLIGIVTAYIALTQLAKRRYIARHGELL